MIKTVIFDLGKVIVPFEIERLGALANHTDIPLTEIKSALLEAPELRLYETGKLTSQEFYSAIREMLELRASFEEFASVWNGIFDTDPLVSEALLASLKNNYKLIVLSDTNELHFDFIRASFPVLRHFDDFCLSFQTGFMKPSRESFAAAVGKADCLSGECLFIDDKLANVMGALKFGMKGFQFEGEDQLIRELERFSKINF